MFSLKQCSCTPAGHSFIILYPLWGFKPLLPPAQKTKSNGQHSAPSALWVKENTLRWPNTTEMHILIESRSQQLLKVDSLLNPVSLSPLQLFPVSPTGRRSGLEGKADLLGLTTQRGRTRRIHWHVLVSLTWHILGVYRVHVNACLPDYSGCVLQFSRISCQNWGWQ